MSDCCNRITLFYIFGHNVNVHIIIIIIMMISYVIFIVKTESDPMSYLLWKQSLSTQMYVNLAMASF